jgi:hypothetical protein
MGVLSCHLSMPLPLRVKWAVLSTVVAWVCSLCTPLSPALLQEQADERKLMRNVTKEVNQMIYNRMGEVNN